jgi:hypothetical protein
MPDCPPPGVAAHTSAGDQVPADEQLDKWVDHIPVLPPEMDQMFPFPLGDVTGPDGLLPWVIPAEKLEHERYMFFW